MQSPPVAELGRIELWASVYGNIAVKPAPIRLLALCTAASRQDSGPAPSRVWNSRPPGCAYCGAQPAD